MNGYMATVGAGNVITPITATITNVTHVTTTITVTTSAAHNMGTGATVTISGVSVASGSTPNGTWVIASTPNSTSFTAVLNVTIGTYSSGGTVTAPEGDCVMIPQGYVPNGKTRGLIWCHGAGGTAADALSLPWVQVLACYYPVVSLDMGIVGGPNGGLYGWGNAQAQGRFDAALAYLTGTLGAKNDGKVFISGNSMGGQNCLAWAANNPTKVAAMFLTEPACALYNIYTNNLGNQAGNIYNATGYPASPCAFGSAPTITSIYDTTYLASSAGGSKFAGIPTHVWYGGADVTANNSGTTGSPIFNVMASDGVNSPPTNGYFLTNVPQATGLIDPTGTHPTGPLDLYWGVGSPNPPTVPQPNGISQNILPVLAMFASNA